MPVKQSSLRRCGAALQVGPLDQVVAAPVGVGAHQVAHLAAGPSVARHRVGMVVEHVELNHGLDGGVEDGLDRHETGGFRGGAAGVEAEVPSPTRKEGDETPQLSCWGCSSSSTQVRVALDLHHACGASSAS